MGNRIGFACDDEDEGEPDTEVAVGEGTATYEPTLAGAVDAIARLRELGAHHVKVGDIEVMFAQPVARRKARKRAR